jgi:hypothetical protein
MLSSVAVLIVLNYNVKIKKLERWAIDVSKGNVDEKYISRPMMKLEGWVISRIT